MNVYEKLSDFILNLILVVIAGGIFATVERDNSFAPTTIYAICAVVILLLSGIFYLLLRINKKTNQKQ
ncbi:hypothetical protein FACS1894156_1780 [Bacteroidia bacterium]|nr:hypothetical protein FACS1894156_1780 [Bacteroidia bacterium]